MNIHPTAIVSPKAKIHESVIIGPYCVISDNVIIEEGTKIHSHVVIQNWTTIGKNNEIFSGAIIGNITQDLKYKGEISYCQIGNNNIIREYVTINRATNKDNSTVIGDNNLFMAYSHIAHDCKIGCNVVIANVSELGGHVIVEDRAIIGGLCSVHQFVRIGKMSIVGASSKVVQDIPPYMQADGNPTKIYGLNSIGLERNGVSEKSKTILKKAFKILYKSKLNTSQAIEMLKETLEYCEELEHLIKFIKESERGICK